MKSPSHYKHYLLTLRGDELAAEFISLKSQITILSASNGILRKEIERKQSTIDDLRSAMEEALKELDEKEGVKREAI